MATNEEVDHAKWVHEQNKEDATRAHDRDIAAWHQANDAAIASATVVLRTLVLINGGAAVTVLTFIGSLIGKSSLPATSISQITAPLIYFALGVAVATLAMATAYLTNYTLAGILSSRIKSFEAPFIAESKGTKRWRKAYYTFIVSSIVLSFASLALFILGMYSVQASISFLH